MIRVNCFILAENFPEITDLLTALQENRAVKSIFLPENIKSTGEKTATFNFNNFTGTSFVQGIAEVSKDVDYVLLLTQATAVRLNQFALERMLNIARDTGAVKIYSDYYEIKEGQRCPHPVIDYQKGSLRDDFNFGPLVLYSTKALRVATSYMKQNFEHAGLYYLRLKISQLGEFIRIPEFLYTISEQDTRKSGQKLFDYVDPKNRQVQLEMEEAVTEHLKDINAWLSPAHTPITTNHTAFKRKASVIIPVRNRSKTIADAIQSVLNQKTDFNFNLIIVDNHSTDPTTEIIHAYAQKDKRIIHIVPESRELGIGGCWNRAVHDKNCGMYAIQLDSDDIYKDENTLQKIVDVFEREKCAMVVGSYQLVNFDLEEIPPGIIDHKEWTDNNGKNNALRINGLGAPRAFFTPVLREINIPNVSYGEDYAVGLAISRTYKIGRIYENIYLCRRWDDNSDAALDILKQNGHNTYKDRIRTIELKARQNNNKSL